MKRTWWPMLALGLAMITLPAEALVQAGAMRPAARVADADDLVIDLRSINGKPTLVLYEDKDSAKLNAPFKDDLARLARGDRYKNAVALVPVADLQGYDYWPIKGFVRDAIRSESKKVGATIYCDWDGSFQRTAGFRRGTSSVVLIGSDGKVRFSSEGALSTEDRARVLALLRLEVEGASGS